MNCESLRILICLNRRHAASSCAGRGSAGVLAELRKQAAARGILVSVEAGLCMGHCARGPDLRVVGGAYYHEVTAALLEPLLDRIEAGVKIAGRAG